MYGFVGFVAAVTVRCHETGTGKIGEMKRQDGRRDIECSGDGTRRHAAQSRPDEQAEDGKPGFLRQRLKKIDGS